MYNKLTNEEIDKRFAADVPESMIRGMHEIITYSCAPVDDERVLVTFMDGEKDIILHTDYIDTDGQPLEKSPAFQEALGKVCREYGVSLMSFMHSGLAYEVMQHIRELPQDQVDYYKRYKAPTDQTVKTLEVAPATPMDFPTKLVSLDKPVHHSVVKELFGEVFPMPPGLWLNVYMESNQVAIKDDAIDPDVLGDGLISAGYKTIDSDKDNVFLDQIFDLIAKVREARTGIAFNGVGLRHFVASHNGVDSVFYKALPDNEAVNVHSVELTYISANFKTLEVYILNMKRA